ncbi:MAG: TolC family protein [Nannocystaceae bacterium]
MQNEAPARAAPGEHTPAQNSASPRLGALEVHRRREFAHSGALPLGLPELLAIVDGGHPRLRAADHEIDAAAADAFAARGTFDTALRIRGVYAPLGYYVGGRIDVAAEQRTPLWGTRLIAGYRLSRGDVPDYYGERRTLRGGEIRAGVEVPLWRGGPIDPGRAALRKSTLDQEIAVADREDERLDLRREATHAYWEWVAAGVVLRIAESQLSLARERADQLQRRVERGDLPAIDALDNERAVLQRDGALIAARRRLEQAALRLSLYLRGGDGRTIVVAPERLPGGMPRPGAVGAPDPESQIAAALAQRPELRGLAAARRQAEVDRRLARNQRAPAIDAGLMVLRDFGRGPASLAPTELQATVFVDVPIQARAARGARKAAEAKMAAIDARAAYARDTIQAEVRDAISALLAAHERIDTAREALEVAESLAVAERQRFDRGASSLLFVNLREQQVAEAALLEAAALLDYHRAVADLEASTASAPASR